MFQIPSKESVCSQDNIEAGSNHDLRVSVPRLYPDVPIKLNFINERLINFAHNPLIDLCRRVV